MIIVVVCMACQGPVFPFRFYPARSAVYDCFDDVTVTGVWKTVFQRPMKPNDGNTWLPGSRESFKKEQGSTATSGKTVT
jgi:hypothetical protein